MDRETVIERIALRSAKWENEERLKFIWNNTLIVGHYDRERRTFDLLTYIDPEEALKVKDWFYRITHKGMLNPETEEDV